MWAEALQLLKKIAKPSCIYNYLKVTERLLKRGARTGSCGLVKHRIIMIKKE
jgi:hypothetical protein